MVVSLRLVSGGSTMTEDRCSGGTSVKRKALLFIILISLMMFSYRINFRNIALSDFIGIAQKQISQPVAVTLQVAEWNAALEFYKTLESFGVADIWREVNRNFDIPDAQVDLTKKTYQVAADILLRPFPPLEEYSIPAVDIDCSNIIYSDALTGRIDPNEKIIVDINLFGWDVDYLEIRLLEYADIIHSFVIPELDVTLKGVAKPMMIPSLLEGRLAQFQNKIDYMPQSASKQLLWRLWNTTDPTERFNALWNFEGGVRKDALDYTKQKYRNVDGNNNAAVYIVQNDGDEIISRKAMAHFKACELREPMQTTFFPNILFKHGISWMWQRSPLSYEFEYHGQDDLADHLRNSIWKYGPMVHRLSESLTADNFRVDPWGMIHMGIGAANHFSNPSHPILGFLKLLSTVDSNVINPIPDEFWRMARNKTLTYVDVRRITYLMCHPEIQLEYSPLYNQNQDVIQSVVSMLPWAVQQFVDRYSWLYSGEGYFETERQLFGCLCEDQNCSNPT